MIWIILLIAILATFSFFKDCVKVIDNSQTYQPGILPAQEYNYREQKRKNLYLDLTLNMWIAGLCWMMFIILIN